MTLSPRIARAAFAASAALATTILLAGCGGDEVVQSPQSPKTGAETVTPTQSEMVSPSPESPESTTEAPTPTTSSSEMTTPTP
ncbi:hypothetical protein C5B85_13115 [Pseudoclavibacter sp. AY1F1]|uniref:hypothetical protein n=1 Tax=Pseudoclavibacter sp. AY1F1 TaxID=2080583 RepID=UPI000CE74653|nr:hypothetical protein [Pseudoclavibacter sp. AY1F1]PPF43630.1 hypothetical protein C5B85_13115 [Pseudoclavibacter sp. AY1F1]